MWRAKDAGRDSIWKFILQNTYKPVFLKNRFDIVLGNPPWLTYAAITNGDYQSEIKRLADDYNVTPANKANMPHLEIAAVFLAHSINYFLRPSGILAFVLPRSFISADQHDRTRAGQTKGVKLIGVWDLETVYPLFRVPSCVLLAIQAHAGKFGVPIAASGVSGLTFTGHLPRTHLHWAEASKHLKVGETRWYYSQLAAGNRRSRSALTQSKNEALTGTNAYADDFKQGATVVPRSFYFVETDGALEGDSDEDRVLNLRPSHSMLRDAKPPWKELAISGRMEARYIFRTAVSKNVLPFSLVNLPLVVLPIARKTKDGSTHIVLLDHAQLMKRGDRYASRWFARAEELWNENRTATSERNSMSYLDRLDFQRGLTEQDLDARYLVLYTGSATDASAAVVDRQRIDLPFIAEHKTYWCQTRSKDEAYYLCSYLNSGFANERIKDFQSRGLFGPRDIHKTIVKLPFPRFDAKLELHKGLARLGTECSARVEKVLGTSDDLEMDARALGRMRSKVREYLDDQLTEIDVIVEQLSTGRSEAAIRASGKGRSRRKGKMLPLFE